MADFRTGLGSFGTPLSGRQNYFQGLPDPAVLQATSDRVQSQQAPLDAPGYFDDSGAYLPHAGRSVQPVEFTFIGGAGTGGGYLSDFKRAFDRAGVHDVRVPNDGPHDMADPHVLADIAAVPGINDLGFSDSLVKSPEIQAAAQHSNDLKARGEQFNLGGYSYGSAASAAMAEAITKNGGHVDNLVLVGAPINKDLYDAVTRNPNIGQVIVKDLTNQGDPVRAGMSDLELMGTVPQLLVQAPQNKGHFYYSGQDAQGAARRDQLADELVRRGVK